MAQPHGLSPRSTATPGSPEARALPTGAAPHFGSAYLHLKPKVLQRTSFCYPDSVFEPQLWLRPE